MSITPEEERVLLEQWLDEVSFDVPATGVPPLEPEEDDED